MLYVPLTSTKYSTMRIVFILVFSLIVSTNTYAQILKELERSTPKERAIEFSNEISKGLMLTHLQNQSILEINLKHAFNIHPIVNSDKNKLYKLKKIKSLDKIRDKKLAVVLNKNQFSLYLKQKKEFIKNTRLKLKSNYSSGR